MEINHLSQGDEHEFGSFEGYFRDPSLAAESSLAWGLGQRMAELDALRGLFSGGRDAARLRVWVFLELAAQPQGRLLRDDVNQLFYGLKPEVLDTVLKRLRDLSLLVWDSTTQDYSLSPLSMQVQALLTPLTRTATEDDDMGALLAQVAGAQAIGLSDAGQIRHLHAQLARLYDEFADAIASGSEARLREAQPRFERALELVGRAGEALTALIRSEHDDPRLEREARTLGYAQARLLSMASQFTRALQQADRQRVTLGSTGITSSDVRLWLQSHPALHQLMGDALSTGIRPVFVSAHDLLDVAEAELERDRPDPQRAQGLPPPAQAGAGELEVLHMPVELGMMIDQLAGWHDAAGVDIPAPHPIASTVLGGRFAQAAYRMQLLPLLGDQQARTLKGQTGDLARQPWQASFEAKIDRVDDTSVSAMSAGTLHPHLVESAHE